MGIVVNRSVVRGSHGAAAEIGFVRFGADPLAITKNCRGPLEETTSGPYVAVGYLQRSEIEATSLEVLALAGADDPHATAVIDDEPRNMLPAIATVSVVLDPEMLVLGGSIGSRFELLSLIRHWISRFGHHGVVVHTILLGECAAVVDAIETATQTAIALSRKEQSACAAH
jgi:glucokinase